MASELESVTHLCDKIFLFRESARVLQKFLVSDAFRTLSHQYDGSLSLYSSECVGEDAYSVVEVHAQNLPSGHDDDVRFPVDLRGMNLEISGNGLPEDRFKFPVGDRLDSLQDIGYERET